MNFYYIETICLIRHFVFSLLQLLAYAGLNFVSTMFTSLFFITQLRFHPFHLILYYWLRLSNTIFYNWIFEFLILFFWIFIFSSLLVLFASWVISFEDKLTFFLTLILLLPYKQTHTRKFEYNISFSLPKSIQASTCLLLYLLTIIKFIKPIQVRIVHGIPIQLYILFGVMLWIK